MPSVERGGEESPEPISVAPPTKKRSSEHPKLYDNHRERLAELLAKHLVKPGKMDEQLKEGLKKHGPNFVRQGIALAALRSPRDPEVKRRSRILLNIICPPEVIYPTISEVQGGLPITQQPEQVAETLPLPDLPNPPTNSGI